MANEEGEAEEYVCKDTNESDIPNLQDAFKIFREKKKKELREKSKAREAAKQIDRDEATVKRLRSRFLQTALSYCGVPYAQRYHDPESPTHRAPLFLDCCGLVRRVLRDMEEDLGFTVGPWNQAYQFDTLPVAVSGPEEMNPGDLVFVSGTYFGQQKKQQRHGMVHVEVWLGEGEKTVGARWQKGRVEIHESYKFVSKSYGNMEYHFRSIETWLKGICRSYCPEHEWAVHQFTPCKYSIFSTAQDQSCGEDEQEGGGGGGEGGENEQEGGGGGGENEQEGGGGGRGENEQEGGGGGEDEKEEKDQGSDGEAESGRKAEEAGSAPPKLQSLSHLNKSTSANSACGKPAPRRSRSRSAARGSARTFSVSGGNAAPLVCEALRGKGWAQLVDTSSTAFTLKWTETSKHINYKEFREGEQIVNHFPNISLLTTKIGLLESLRALQRLQGTTGMRGPRVESFLPETYRLDREDERSEFTRVYSSGELWICKPTGANQGKGIFLVRDLHEVLERLESDEKHCKIASRPTPRIAQRYITPPLLLGGRKFDIRVYLLVVAARPFVVLYADGYVRLSCASYNVASADLTVHLTNQFQQKKHPDFSTMREDTVWDYRKLGEQLTQDHGLPSDWVSSTLTRRMKAIMSMCFQSVRHKLSHRVGFFDLLGFDFMLDSHLNVWLIEVNVNPAMHTNCATLQALVPPLVTETLDIAIEIFDKCRRGKRIFPLSSPSLFSVLHSS